MDGVVLALASGRSRAGGPVVEVRARVVVAVGEGREGAGEGGVHARWRVEAK